MPKTEKGREVLQHPTTQEAATLLSEQRADYDHLSANSTTNSQTIFSTAYLVALAKANEHPELLDEV